MLSTFDDPVVAVDGIRIGSTEIDTDTSEIHAVFMSPKHSALDILLTLTYKGASAVLIVCPGSDPEIETIYRNEIHHICDEVVEEILEKRTKPKKPAPKKTPPKKKAPAKTTKKKATESK